MIGRYPDRGCGDLRRALAVRHGVTEAQVLVGNGSSELIWLAAVAYLAPGDQVLVLGPAFGEYERAARLTGAEPAACRATAGDGFQPPLARFEQYLREKTPRLAFLTNPNNPTGQMSPPDHLRLLATRHPQTLFVVDEAYADCRPSPDEWAATPAANVVRLRSMTKAHGLTGLRLGYALGAGEVIAVLRSVQPPWSVNAAAQAAGLAALRDAAEVSLSVAAWAAAAAELVSRVRAAGFAPVASVVPFFLLRVGDARGVRSRLLREGLLVRDCASFGLPEFVRISARRPEENARLVEALVRVGVEGGLCRD